MIAEYPKAPAAYLDYTLDWSVWLAGDTIGSSSWFFPEELTSTDEIYTPTTTTVWIGGGELGQRYTVTNRIVTMGERTDERSITILVQAR